MTTRSRTTGRTGVVKSVSKGKAPAKRKRNRAGRPTADELERRKLRVMEVATEMFVNQGYAATTLLDIAKQAGVATRTLYQHFGDKEAIFREVIFARDAAAIAPPEVTDEDDLVSALTRAAQYAHEIALRTRSVELMRLMIAESARFPELMSKVANAIFSRFKGNVAKVFRALAERGLVPESDHDQSADLFVDLLLGNSTVMIYFGWSNAAPTAADVAIKVDLFIRGRFGAQVGAAKAAGSKSKARKPA
ncbi:MAG: TetR/AcrR family transcriptional regulator [Sphingomonadales bacterium]|nr:TetR/AcrR family transcriptional regulator [Sphingomonadales bacterium]